MKTVIVMPVFNNLSYTKIAIDTLMKYTEDFELIIVNDASTDDTEKWLIANNIRHVSHVENQSFTKAVNTGIKEALKTNCKFVCVVNNDVIFTKDWLKILIKFTENDVESYVISPFLTIGDYAKWSFEKTMIYHKTKFPTGKIHIGTDQGIMQSEIRTFRGYHYIPGLMAGPCFLVKCEVFKKIGLLNEKLRTFWSDEEFKFRCIKYGFNVCQVLESRVHHLCHKTVRKPNKKLDTDIAKDTNYFCKLYPYMKRYIQEELGAGYGGRRWFGRTEIKKVFNAK